MDPNTLAYVLELVSLILAGFVWKLWSSVNNLSGTVSSLSSKLTSVQEQLTREHKEGTELHSRQHTKIEEDLTALGKDLTDKVGKVMEDHAASDIRGTRVEIKLDDMLDHVKRWLPPKDGNE